MRVFLLLLACACVAIAVPNGLAKTPQMGWNSWNHYSCHINEDLIKKTADALVSTGLAAAGYKYVNLDDCWQLTRDSKGNIQPDPKAFPSGMKALADYVHSKGLLFGLYSSAGTKTCQGRPGSLGHEVSDANSYASWGVDYLKYDNCYNEGIAPTKRYPTMRDALNQTGRPIFYSLCEWGVDQPATWAPKVGNSWRTTPDISDNWKSMTTRIDLNNVWYTYAHPGGWNDPDMLEVGNGGMNFEEYKSHFSLWALSKAPLLIGTDITNMSNETSFILMAKEVIAVSQDSLGVQGHKAKTTLSVQQRKQGIEEPAAGELEVWTGPLSGGSKVVILFNRSTATDKITATWKEIGLQNTNTASVRDLWAEKDLGSFTGSFSASVPSHGVVMVKVTCTKGC